MAYHADGRKSSLSIPGIAEAEIEQLDGQGGGLVLGLALVTSGLWGAAGE